MSIVTEAFVHFWRGWNIGQRMLLCFGLLMGVLLVNSFCWRASVGDLGSSLQQAVNRTAMKLRMAGDLRTEFRSMWAEARGTQFSVVIRLLHDKDARGRQDAVSAGCVVCHSAEMQEEGRSRFLKSGGRLRRELGELRKLAASVEEGRLLDAISRDVEEWVSLYGQYLQLASSDRYDEAHALMTEKIAPLLAHADQTVGSLLDAQRAALTRAAAGAEEEVAMNRSRALLLAALGLGLGILVFVMIRWMTAQLRGVAAEVRAGAVSVASSARQTSASSAMLAQGAVEQMSSLSEAAAAEAQIGSVSGGNEKRAQSAAEEAFRAKRESEHAQKLLGSTRAAMAEAEAASAQTSAILRVIDEIAFQTNILALNAAVEAARAGEAGLSFAVVAGEVRTLARRCAEASQQITELVDNAAAKSRDSRESLAQFDTALRRWADGSAGLESLLAQVAADSRRQSQDMERLSGSLQQVDKVAQVNASAAEESAAASNYLKEEAATLSKAAEHLMVLVGDTRNR